jgi:hypothetical protein
MIDFPRDESLMMGGLDAWHCAKQACPPELVIEEERLQARLGVREFRLPVDHKDPQPGVHSANLDIPAVRFPLWHYCHRCGAMDQLTLFSTPRRCPGRPYPGMSCAQKSERSRPFLIPVRIVAVCERGHIEDFPFMHWVHRNKPATPSCKLRFLAGRSSSLLTGIKISCSCGEEKTLAGIFDFDQQVGGALQRISYTCRGSQPWLGRLESPGLPCGSFLRVLQRGASNAYFPQVVSSIYLPLWAEEAERNIIDSLERPEIWDALTSGLVDGKRIDPTRSDVVAKMWSLNPEQLLAVAQRKLDGVSIQAVHDEEEYRRQEYSALLAPRGGPETDLFVEVIHSNQLGATLASYFSSVALVKKLRETRALAGFSRLLPPDPEGTPDRIQQLKLDQRINWLPATVVRGEGIFLQLSTQALDEWLNHGILSRTAHLSQNFNQRRLSRGQQPRSVTAPFLLLHALAHSLINQLSYECGYGSASLRERIYCNTEPGSERMMGVLIYTASGDSEGTMGGLVRQGGPQKLLQTLVAAVQKAQWCSSDPICIETAGQGTDNANLAACHGCLLISETSCEEGNRLLDRAMLVGTPSAPEIGFFRMLS